MKPIYTIWALLFFPLCLLAQSRLQWTSFEYTPHMQRNDCKAMCTDKFGTSYVVNQTQSAISYYISDRFFGFDASGARLWQYDNDTCLTGCTEKYNQVVPLDGNGAIFVGIRSTSAGNELRMKRLNAAGALVWEQSWADGTVVDVVKAALDSAGDLVLALNVNHFVTFDVDYEIAKFDTATGSSIWYTTIPPDVGSDGYHIADEIADMVIGPGNVIYGCGTSGDPWSGAPGHNSIFRVEADGAFTYRVICDSSRLKAIAVDGSGGVCIFGEMGTGSVHLEKRNAADGAMLWTANPLMGPNMSAVAVAADDSGNVYALSNFFATAVSNSDFLVSKYSNSGMLVWQHSYLEWLGGVATPGNTGAVEMHKHSTGLYVLSSKASSTYSFIVVSKIDRNGNLLVWDTSAKQATVGINRNYHGYMDVDSAGNAYVSRTSAWGSSVVGNVLQKFADTTTIVPALLTAEYPVGRVNLFPNPASGHVTFDYTEVTTPSLLQVFDMQGRLLITATLTGKETTINTESLDPGLYLCRLLINGISTEARFCVLTGVER